MEGAGEEREDEQRKRSLVQVTVLVQSAVDAWSVWVLIQEFQSLKDPQSFSQDFRAPLLFLLVSPGSHHKFISKSTTNMFAMNKFAVNKFAVNKFAIKTSTTKQEFWTEQGHPIYTGLPPLNQIFSLLFCCILSGLIWQVFETNPGIAH